jgi:hypothetical protein
VGNEPEAQIGSASFAALQRMSWEEIKAACPSCVVVAGGAPQWTVPNTGFACDAASYLSLFDQHYAPILAALAGSGFDVFDLHWYGRADGDYRKLGPALAGVRQRLAANGFADRPIWITEMGAYSGTPAAAGPIPAMPRQTEQQQAADYFKRFVYSLAVGVGKVFPAYGLVEGFKNDDSYFDHTGFVYDGSGSDDLGRGVKKLAFFTYRKMTELLAGCDWSSVEVLDEAGEVFLVRVPRAGAPVWIGWSDGATAARALTGLSAAGVRVTSIVPHFDEGRQVVDYAAAFDTSAVAVAGGSASVSLGAVPVVVEPQ